MGLIRIIKASLLTLGVRNVITQQGLDLDPEDRQLCADCVGEVFLASTIEKRGQESLCSYCGKDRKCFSIAKLTDVMEIMFEQHFDLTDNYPTGYEWAIADEFGWERHGDPVVDVIQMTAEIDREPAEDIHAVLADRHYDEELVKMSEEGPFDEDAHYESKEVDDYESKAEWNRFEESLKFEGRYFNRVAEGVLRSTFENLQEHKSKDGRAVIVDAGPESNFKVIYRARVFQATDNLEEALKRPDVEIGAPPATLAANGRMNAHGIAVFYGATDPSIALAEVRPPVGSKVVVGRFEIIRPLKLLDIEALRSVYAEGSIFDPDYLRRLKRAKFLRWLSGQITQPVMPDDERFGYLATQAMADFLAAQADPPLDGIVYPSVQGSDRKVNIVLFHQASRVELLAIPGDAQISVMYSWSTEEGEMPNYVVWEEVNDQASEDGDKLAPFPISADSDPSEKYDERQPTLRLDVSSLEVRHVESVQFHTESHLVTRHRIKRPTQKEDRPDQKSTEESFEF